jgi:calcineurin-like phosphoesterase family protein
LHHEEIKSLCNRADNFEELLFKRWRLQVKPEDVVINLGDTSFKIGCLKEEMDALPGKKVLIIGNHDPKPAEWYMSHGFDLAVEELQMIYKGVKLVFTHIPQRLIFPMGAINICGHWHNNDHRSAGIELTQWHRLMALEGTKHPDSQAMLMGYRPFNLKEILKPQDAAHSQSFI